MLYITKVRTESGDLQIDYNALANLPKSDATLSIDNAFADAKATGDAINNLNTSLSESIDNVSENLNSAVDELNGSINNLSELIGDVSVSERINSLRTDITLELLKKAETAIYDGIFSADSWSDVAPYTQTITVEGVFATDNPFVDVNLSGVTDGTEIVKNWICIDRVTVTDYNTVVGYCYEEKPVVDVPIIFKVVR